MADVVKLTIRPPRGSVLHALEDVVEIARAEPQASCFVVMVGQDGQITSGGCVKSTIGLLGAIEYAKARIAN